MTEALTSFELTAEQRLAVDYLVSSPKDVRSLGGLGGVGKTFCIREVVKRLPGYAVCAYTGKAAQVLRRKGVDASTIHSLIYHPVVDEDGSVSFELRRPWEFDPDGVIVDESSMVSQELYTDLKSLDVPLIFIGDHGQLEPVGSRGFNLMESPDVVLETIHRNAGEIALFANHLRQGNEARDWDSEKMLDGNEHAMGKVSIVSELGLDDADLVSDDCQIICAFNKTRVSVNNLVREHLGRPEYPVVGDRVMCLQNDRKVGVYNGMQGVVREIDVDKRWMVFCSSGVDYRVRYHPDSFGSEKPQDRRSGVIPFDYAYCVTAHKFQGDESDHVIVLEQRCDLWDHTRWAYTAASRAKRKLTWVLG